jgi:ribonuclease III
MIGVQNTCKNYQRLEFLGDRVLNLIVSQYLYTKFFNDTEGDLTKKLRFTSNDNLEEIIDKLPDEFKKELLNFKGGFKTEVPELIADDLEAFIGNYYLKHGPIKTINYFENLLAREIDAFDPNTDYISNLQIYTQKNLKPFPDYNIAEVEQEKLLNNQHLFYCEVSIENILFGKCIENSKSKAKKQAAFAALKKLNIMP